MVVPPPIAAPCTAATIGLSKLISASIKRACGLSPAPGGFFRKSCMSLPALNESPAPCQSTTRISSSFAASFNRSANVMYMADVIAFFLAGRFNWIRKMFPERSVMMSLICDLLGCLRGRGWFPDDATRAQAFDFFHVEAEFLENLFVMFADFRCAFRRNFGHAVHLNRTANRRGQLIAGSFQRNDDVIGSQLRIIDDLLRIAHGAEGDVNAIEDFIPMRHRLRTEDFIEHCRQLRPVLG